MKQGEAAKANFDLDDLERQLASAAAPRRAAGDDPLAELARIVGYGEQAAARSSGLPQTSFDDFLVNPPRSISKMMGEQNNRAALPPIPIDDGFSAPPTPFHVSVPAKLQDELAAALGEGGPLLRPTLPVDEPPAPQPEAIEPPAVTAPQASPSEVSDPRFEDMLKEFDATMRNVGAQPLTTPEAFAVPPPRPTLHPSLAYDPEAEAAQPPLAPAAAVGRSRFGLALAGGVIGVALVGVASLLAFGGGAKTGPVGAAPVIAAKAGATKERPANPGGVEVPNQDKEVLARTPTVPRAERVTPREEQPVDLVQAQRSVDASPAQPGVRQIPGVLVVGPSSTQPPASATPSPRPVASVPITIAGQPPVAETSAPAQPSALRAAATPVVTATPTASTPTAPASPVASAPVTSNAAASTPAASSPAAATEPRRVRAVPIKPEEGAPTRAQAQPRVVTPPTRPAAPPAAPAQAAEADDSNAPLRITPQASRVPAAPTRTASIPSGIVPTSTSVSPATTQSTSAETAASGGGGFAVQIAAEGSQDAAQAKFNRMRSQHSGVLGSVSPTIRSAEVNGRSVYRVRVGQMSREEAVGLCERLKADGGSCFVARN